MFVKSTPHTGAMLATFIAAPGSCLELISKHEPGSRGRGSGLRLLRSMILDPPAGGLRASLYRTLCSGSSHISTIACHQAEAWVTSNGGEGGIRTLAPTFADLPV